MPVGIWVLFFFISFLQNMAFTLAGRSRTSGDWVYHFKCAILSNGFWWATRLIGLSLVWDALEEGNIWLMVITGVVYTIATSSGSALMLWWMIPREEGKKRVGAR